MEKSVRIRPMLLDSVSAPFDDEDYFFEFKFDGLRMIADLRDGVLVYNRNLNSRNINYPDITRSLKALPCGIVLDGEIIAVAKKTGKQDFYKALESDLSKTYKFDPHFDYYFMAFDVIYFENKNISKQPLFKRRKILENIITDYADYNIKAVDSFRGIGKVLYQTAQNENLEGIIAKKTSSAYLEGARSKDWLKIKCLRIIDVHICAYFIKTRPVLCLGLKSGDKYVYVGNVGNGLNEKQWSILSLSLQKLHTDTNPFSNYSDNSIQFVKPALRIKVKYIEQLSNGKLRQPIIENINAGI